MASFFDLFKNFLMIGLVVVGIIGFGIMFQSENNAPEQMSENALINDTYSEMVKDMESFRDQSQSQKELFESENPTVGFGTILLFSVVSAGKVFNSMIVGLFNSIIKLPVVILGLNPVVVSVLSVLFVFTIIIGLWIVYKLGG